MADSDQDYDMDLSDDANTRPSHRPKQTRNDPNSRNKAATSSKPKEVRARWEAGAQKNWNLQEGEDGDLEGVLFGIEEASKRSRLMKDTTPLQRGIIRHTLLIVDCSSAMLEKDLRPTRFLLTLTYTMAFIREFFDQNPISQLGILGMRDGLGFRVSELSGNPNDHLLALKGLRGLEPSGNASLQNGLDMARAALYHTPSHGTREVVVVLGALSTSDPGDIHATVSACARDKLRVTIIGLAAQLHICAEIVRRTNNGDVSGYNVALDEVHYRELLLAITTPPVLLRNSDPNSSSSNPEETSSALLLMGFPSRDVEAKATVCACHGNLTNTGYKCSRCKAKLCGLPSTCPSCDLTLLLSTHLARSYHHLFPLLNWKEVPWSRAREKEKEKSSSSRHRRRDNTGNGTGYCKGCMTKFPDIPPEKRGAKGMKEVAAAAVNKRAKGASESSRYECPACENFFCIDCDVFCHEVVHNCPGCLGRIEDGGGGVEDGEEGNGEGNGNGVEGNGEGNGNGVEGNGEGNGNGVGGNGMGNGVERANGDVIMNGT